MSHYQPLAMPRCCALGATNLEWFPNSAPEGAWHASSFAFNARVDAPTTERYESCPFCGAALPPPALDSLQNP